MGTSMVDGQKKLNVPKKGIFFGHSVNLRPFYNSNVKKVSI